MSFSSGGRVATLRILHSDGELVLRGEELRKSVGYTIIPSTQFAIESIGQDVVLSGYGAGHAVGMCQWGAKELAELGYPFSTILRVLLSRDGIAEYDVDESSDPAVFLMQLSEFDFPFDASLIATQPSLPRDHARLLVLQRGDRSLAHRRVDELPDLLHPGDLLVVNNTKVMAARVTGRKRPSGAEVEILFVKDLGDAMWEVLIKGTFRPGQILEMDVSRRLRWWLSVTPTRTTVRVESPIPVSEWLQQHGRMPLPPYMKRAPTDQDREWYQTMFAQHEGAIAAPTAGLHFTPDLLGTTATARGRI